MWSARALPESSALVGALDLEYARRREGCQQAADRTSECKSFPYSRKCVISEDGRISLVQNYRSECAVHLY